MPAWRRAQHTVRPWGTKKQQKQQGSQHTRNSILHTHKFGTNAAERDAKSAEPTSQKEGEGTSNPATQLADLDKDAIGGDAGLAHVAELGRHQSANRLVQIGVVEPAMCEIAIAMHVSEQGLEIECCSESGRNASNVASELPESASTESASGHGSRRAEQASQQHTALRSSFDSHNKRRVAAQLERDFLDGARGLFVQQLTHL
jgi:hypothetical protein